jgi:hypothetical protein
MRCPGAPATSIATLDARAGDPSVFETEGERDAPPERSGGHFESFAPSFPDGFGVWLLDFAAALPRCGGMGPGERLWAGGRRILISLS